MTDAQNHYDIGLDYLMAVTSTSSALIILYYLWYLSFVSLPVGCHAFVLQC